MTLLCGVLGAGCTGPQAGPDGGSSVDAEDGSTTELEQRIAELASPLVDPTGAPGKTVGLLVAVASPALSTSMGFGVTAIGGSAPPTGDTVFEIGSITKVFTGFLLARALGRGDLDLEDPIDPFFPLGAPHGARSITLLDLATHTSGLPLFPTNMHAPQPNPGAGYTVADLENFMSSYALEIEPGTMFQYSNLGTGVLGHVLRVTAGAPSFESLVIQEITQPLGLGDTAVTLSSAQESRMAQGYESDEPAPVNDIGAGLDAGGALRSTGNDLVQFITSATGEGPVDAAAAWTLVLEPRRPSPLGENGRSGLLINVEDYGGRVVYSKAGGTAGFASQIVFTTSPPLAVVLLANSKGTAGLHELGLAILDELASGR